MVTGANKGIGLAIVRRLCKEFNGDVYLTARSEENGATAIATLSVEGLKPLFHQLDIASAESIETLKKHILEKYGGIDILVNNAGMAYKNSSTAPFLEQATVTLRTNFTGTLDVSRAFLPIVRPHGRIVNVSSMAGHLSQLAKPLQERFASKRLSETELVELMAQFVKGVSEGDHLKKGWSNRAYGVSKVGVTALTRVHAREVAGQGREDVLVNACCPGWVKTDMAGLEKPPLSPDEGAVTPCLLAMLPAGSPSGRYWTKGKIAEW